MTLSTSCNQWKVLAKQFFRYSTWVTKKKEKKVRNGNYVVGSYLSNNLSTWLKKNESYRYFSTHANFSTKNEIFSPTVYGMSFNQKVLIFGCSYRNMLNLDF